MPYSQMADRDRELFGQICRKDQKAFEELYRSHYKRLLVLAYKYVGNEEVAEEIVNDTFLKLWTDGARLRIAYALSPYLSKSVVNRSLNMLRQQSQQFMKQSEYEITLAQDEGMEDEGLAVEENLLKLERVLESLPPQCKKILLMSKFEKFKQQEIADTLNLSIKTVKNQLTIGYEKIRNALSDQLTVSVILVVITMFSKELI